MKSKKFLIERLTDAPSEYCFRKWNDIKIIDVMDTETFETITHIKLKPGEVVEAYLVIKRERRR